MKSWWTKRKKQISKEEALKMNEMFWNGGLTLYQVASVMKISRPVVERVVTTTRAEFYEIKQRFAK